MNMGRNEILKVLQQKGKEIQSYKVRRLGLFGSAARNELSPDSDLDFVVEFDEKTFDHYMDLKFFLEDLFGRKVDLVIAEAIKPSLRDRILEEAVYAPRS
jgi:uncharacterized protein